MRDIFWLLGILFVLSCAVYAVTGVNVWASNWSETQPTVISRAEIPDAAPQDMFGCSGQEATISVTGIGVVDRACVFGTTGSIRMARLGLTYAIAFPSSTQFHELRNVCPNAECAYSGASDTLITHSHLGEYRLGINLYRQFSKQVKKHFDFSTMRSYFQFEPSKNPDYSLKIGDISLQGESVAFSANGQYAIVEARTYGFFRIEIDTLEVRRVIAPGATYGLLNDPHYELAISNDGSKVALAGYRGQTSVYLIDSHCGDTPVADLPRSLPLGSATCEVYHLDDVSTVPGFYYSFQPRFNADGSRLGVSAYKRDNTVERFIYGVAPSDSSVQYIAMGDSFTSGEGEESDYFYKESTVGGDPKCHVSVRSYPYRIAQQWNVHSRSVACSGAKTSDVIVNSGNYSGQFSLLLGMSLGQVSQSKEAALGHFQSGIVQQGSFVSEYQPSIVSVGIGGNDAGLVAKLSGCLGIDTCEWAKDPQKRRATASEILSVYPKIREAISNVKSLSPGSDVVSIGYPQIIATAPNASCGVVVGTLLNTEERIFIAKSISLLNKVMQSAAYAEKAGYIDVEDAFEGNKLCETSKTPAVNAIRLGDDIAPVSFLEDFRIIGAESFHPTFTGHELVAKSILSTKPTTDSLGNCGECLPNSPPQPSEYWGGFTADNSGSDSDGQVRQVYQPISDSGQYVQGDTISIKTDPAMFAADTKAIVELHSDVMDLGEVTVSSDGSVEVAVVLPVGVPPGYHTVHILGVAQDNSLVDIYTTIAVVDKNTTSSEQRQNIESGMRLDDMVAQYPNQYNSIHSKSESLNDPLNSVLGASSSPSLVGGNRSTKSVRENSVHPWQVLIVLFIIVVGLCVIGLIVALKSKQIAQEPGG